MKCLDESRGEYLTQFRNMCIKTLIYKATV